MLLNQKHFFPKACILLIDKNILQKPVNMLLILHYRRKLRARYLSSLLKITADLNHDISVKKRDRVFLKMQLKCL